MSMMIRLQRHGNTHRPFYHVVVTDKRNSRDSGRFLEKLGHYDPGLEPSSFSLKGDRIQHWFGLGAQLSPTVEKLVKLQKITLERKKKSE